MDEPEASRGPLHFADVVMEAQRGELHTPYNGKTTLLTTLADPQGFRQDMWDVLQQQAEKGILESYNFIAEEKLSPYDFVFPIILAGLAMERRRRRRSGNNCLIKC